MFTIDFTDTAMKTAGRLLILGMLLFALGFLAEAVAQVRDRVDQIERRLAARGEREARK